MGMGTYEVIYLLSSILGTYGMYKIINVFYNKKLQRHIRDFVLFAIYDLLVSFVYLFLEIPIATLIINLVFIFCITLIYQFDIKKSLIVTLSSIGIVGVVEILVMSITGYINATLFSEMKYSAIIGIISVNLVTYIVSLGLNGFKNIKNRKRIPNGYWGALIFIPIGTLYLIYIIFDKSNQNSQHIVISSALILLLNFIMFSMYNELSLFFEKKIEDLTVLQLNQSYMKQLSMMKLSISKTKSFEHDLNRHFVVLQSMIDNEYYSKASGYLNNMISEIDGEHIISSTGNVVIDSIINYEIDGAKLSNVIIDFEHQSIPENLNIQEIDLTIILSNLMKNALNATLKLDGNRKINMKMDYKKGVFYFEIANSYDGYLILSGNKIETRNEDKENHGYGLSNIEKVVEKYDGEFTVKHDDQLFIAQVMLYI